MEMRWKMVFERDRRDTVKSITGVPVIAPQYAQVASTGRGHDRKVRINFRW